MRTRAARKGRQVRPAPAGQAAGRTGDGSVDGSEHTERALRDAKARRQFVRKIASCAVVAVFVAALVDAFQFKGLGQWFPLLASSLGLLISVIYALLILAGKSLGTSAFEIGNEELDGAGLEDTDIPQWWVFAGLAGFPVLTAALGLVPALVLWMPAFLILVARLRWWVGILGMLAAVGVLYLMQLYIGMVFPGSVFVS